MPAQSSLTALLLLLLSRFSHVRLLATPWTAAYQAPLSMGFSRQEYWSGMPLPSLVNSKWVLKLNTVLTQAVATRSLPGLLGEGGLASM